jgi:hypothetical protein
LAVGQTIDALTSARQQRRRLHRVRAHRLFLPLLDRWSAIWPAVRPTGFRRWKPTFVELSMTQVSVCMCVALFNTSEIFCVLKLYINLCSLITDGDELAKKLKE